MDESGDAGEEDALAVFADLRRTTLEPLVRAGLEALMPLLAELAAAHGATPLPGTDGPEPRDAPEQESPR